MRFYPSDHRGREIDHYHDLLPDQLLWRVPLSDPGAQRIAKLKIRTMKELLACKEFDSHTGYSLKAAGKTPVRKGEQSPA